MLQLVALSVLLQRFLRKQLHGGHEHIHHLRDVLDDLLAVIHLLQCLQVADIQIFDRLTVEPVHFCHIIHVGAVKQFLVNKEPILFDFQLAAELTRKLGDGVRSHHAALFRRLWLLFGRFGCSGCGLGLKCFDRRVDFLQCLLHLRKITLASPLYKPTQ